MTKHVKGEIDSRSDLKGKEAVVRQCGVPPDKIEPSSNLEEQKGDQNWLQYFGPIDVTEDLHHRVIDAWADQKGEMVSNVECQEDSDNGDCRYAVGDP